MTLKAKGITIEAWIYLTNRPKDGNSASEFTSEGRWISPWQTWQLSRCYHWADISAHPLNGMPPKGSPA